MAFFRVEWKKSTKKDLRKLPASLAARVVGKVEALGANHSRKGLRNLAARKTHTGFGWVIIGLCTTCFASGSLSKSSECDIGKMSIAASEKLQLARLS